MISKKVLGPALTGTGAVGASGTLAWTLGLLDEEILDDVVDVKVDAAKPEPDQKEKGPSKPEDPRKPPEVAKESRRDVPPNETRGGQKTQTGAGGGSTGGKRKITHVSRAYFTGEGGASSVDRLVVDSKLNLKVELKNGLQSLIVNAEGVGEEKSWQCTIKAISIEEIYSNYDFKEFERQRSELETALKDENNKNQFVANCSYTRMNDEKTRGEESTIELETEKISYDKFKFKESEEYFKRLWTEDFRGIYRLSTEEEENIVKGETNWIISGERGESEAEGKVTVSLKSKRLTCHISGDYRESLGSRTFKKDELEEILKWGRLNSGKLEKKRYLIRNCRKNKEGIKGLKIKVDGSKWWFDDDSLKKISEGMYENPK